MTSIKDVYSAACELMGYLGSSPNEIAKRLMAEGIKGVKNAEKNPICEFLKRRGITAVIDIKNMVVTQEGENYEARTPLVIAEFLQYFQADHFLKLIVPAPRTLRRTLG